MCSQPHPKQLQYFVKSEVKKETKKILARYGFENNSSYSLSEAFSEADETLLFSAVNGLHEQARHAIIQTISEFLFLSAWSLSEERLLNTFPAVPKPLLMPVIRSTGLTVSSPYSAGTLRKPLAAAKVTSKGDLKPAARIRPIPFDVPTTVPWAIFIDSRTELPPLGFDFLARLTSEGTSPRLFDILPTIPRHAETTPVMGSQGPLSRSYS